MRCCLISFLFLFLQFQSIKNMLIQTHVCRATKALVSRLEFKKLKTVTKKVKDGNPLCWTPGFYLAEVLSVCQKPQLPFCLFSF